MPPYDPYAQDQEQQMQMQNALRQRMQRFGGVNPMNFNPQAQGAMGFAPSAPQESFGGGGNSFDGAIGGMNDQMGQMQMEPPPEQVAPQMPQYMQQQRNNMMRQRMNVNRGMMQQRPPQAGVPGMGAAPNNAGYKQGGAPADFMGMRNAAAGMGALPGSSPMTRSPDFNPAAISKPAIRKPMGGMGRLAGGLGAAGSAMGFANRARNKQKMAAKKPAAPKAAGGQLQAPPTFGGPA